MEVSPTDVLFNPIGQYPAFVCLQRCWSDLLAREKGKRGCGGDSTRLWSVGAQFGASAICWIDYLAVQSNLASLSKKANMLFHPVRFLRLLFLLFPCSEQGMEHDYLLSLNMSNPARGALLASRESGTIHLEQCIVYLEIKRTGWEFPEGSFQPQERMLLCLCSNASQGDWSTHSS